MIKGGGRKLLTKRWNNDTKTGEIYVVYETEYHVQENSDWIKRIVLLELPIGMTLYTILKEVM